MTLARTSILNGLAQIVRLAVMLGLNKILALYAGPSGYAVIGQFQNAMSIILSFGSGGINTGVTKLTAELFDDAPAQARVWRTAVGISGALILGTAIATAIASSWAARSLLHDENYSSVVFVFALAMPLFVLNNLLLAIVNGRKLIRSLVAINIASSIVMLIVTGGLVILWGLYGALLGLAINQSVVCLVTVALCWRQSWFRLENFVGAIDWPVARQLGGYAVFALVAAFLSPLTLILIRDGLIDRVGLHDAGYWEAIWRISSTYLAFVTTTLGVYFLPRFAELRDAASLARELRVAYAILLPLTAVMSVTIYLARDPIVSLLLSPDFAPTRDYFGWQLLGDSLKIGSWIMAYLLLARGKIVALTVLELAGSAVFLASFYAFEGEGVTAATKAYVLNYLLYWIFTAGACWYHFIYRDDWTRNAAPAELV